jgi:hypothetical protein
MLGGAADPTPGAPPPPMPEGEASGAPVAPPPAAAAPVKRGRGRPKGSTKRGAGGRFQRAPEGGQGPAAVGGLAIGEARAPDPFEQAAVLNGIAFGLVAMIGGEETLPSEKEATLMHGALGEYLASKPDFQVRPEILLAGVYLPYVARSLMRPTAKEKIKFAASKLWSGIKSIFRRKNKEAPKNEAVAAEQAAD